MRGRRYVCVSGYLTFTTRTLSRFSFPETFRNLWMGGMFRAEDEGEGVIKTGSRHKLVNVKSVYFRKAKKSTEGLSVPERHAGGWRLASRGSLVPFQLAQLGAKASDWPTFNSFSFSFESSSSFPIISDHFFLRRPYERNPRDLGKHSI